jgi:eukaryotic-like serine/threonine-protein kinase
MALTPGTKLGPYEVIGPIGAGGVGEVYRARDTLLKRDVAIKILAGSYSVDTEKLRQFQQEAEAAAALNHPNILSVYHIGRQDGVPYIVTELLQGKNLREHLLSGRLSLPKALDCALQIAHGLAAAHEKRIVHRDLKPDNLFLTDDGRVKILDFGMAELMPSLPSDANASTAEHDVQPGKVLGTLRYMSPEQLRGQDPDPRSDIFAFGAILYEMLTNKRAFRGETYADVIGAILKENPPSVYKSNPDVPPALERIVFRCLEKNPGQRFQSALDLAFALEELTGTRSPTPSLTAESTGRTAGGTRKRILWLFVPAAALVLVAVGVWLPRLLLRPGAQIRSLAVLPFQNVSGDPAQDYFVDGMTDELTTELANIGALRVVSRTSTMRYKRSNEALPQIARELQVDGVIEGSVLRSGDTVRITTQLVQAKTDKQLWAHSYERELKDVLRLQSEVAHDIAEEIKITTSPREQKLLTATRTVNPQAYEAYLKGRYHWNKATEEEFREAMKYFEQAIALDRNYAPAYAGLADFYWATDKLNPREAMLQAKENVLEALQLDGDLAEAHKTLAILKFYADWDWVGAEREFQRALALNPNFSEGHRMYSVYLSELGRSEEALSEVQMAQRLDPLSLTTAVTVGWTFYYARQYDRAIEQCRNVVELDPDYSQGHDCLGSSYLAKGSFPEAVAECKRSASGSGHDPIREAGLGRAYALAGETAEARKILAQLNTVSNNSYVPPYVFAMLYAALGEKDQAFTWLDKGYQQRDPYLVRLRVDEAMDPLRSDPRFTALLGRVGLAPPPSTAEQKEPQSSYWAVREVSRTGHSLIKEPAPTRLTECWSCREKRSGTTSCAHSADSPTERLSEPAWKKRPAHSGMHRARCVIAASFLLAREPAA